MPKITDIVLVEKQSKNCLIIDVTCTVTGELTSKRRKGHHANSLTWLLRNSYVED